jgi:hypothetical protein
MKMAHRTKVARRKRNIIGKNRTRDKVIRGTLKKRKRQPKPKYKIGIKNPGTRRQLHLKVERTSKGFDRKASGLEFVMRVTGMSSGFRKVRDWRL